MIEDTRFILFLLHLEHVESYLGYPHLWVQLAASQLFGLLFAAWQPENLLKANKESKSEYLAVDTRKKV